MFGRFGTTDFEKVIEFVRAAAILVEIYESSGAELVGRFSVDAGALKDSLAEVLARSETASPNFREMTGAVEVRRTATRTGSPGKKPLRVHFFDSATAKVWDSV